MFTQLLFFKTISRISALPTKQMANLPVPKTYWKEADFADLAEKARQIDQKLDQNNKND